ncbi:LacI family DNA-binding transcriptional regulator [Isoptericola chiayiensis]|uniref:LacI family DNA-binding transcriptional regulator n=1 Tax=Isoptericola chiayiensis TaxID=579446 RepID=A0ABP8YK15_9MICO|nr:substrate-binding domain-containing protein [Isoptericola chiayiensis]NOW01400.1 DNA-binding LacI/PurR family transcriptional regulator [Isoptericola chiayiensis]
MGEAHGGTTEVRTDGTGVARRPRTGVVLLAVPDLEEPWFAELTSLLVRRAEERGLAVVVRQTFGDHGKEIDVANGVGVPPSDGLLHIPRSLTVADLTRRTRPGPLVLLGEHVDVGPFAHVTIDNHAAAAAATEHVLRGGRRRVAMVGRRSAAPSDAANRRYEGYVDALLDHGIEPDPQLVAAVEAFTPAEGDAALDRLIATGADFDAVVCANDSVALGVLHRLAAAGRRVPDDVAVIGIDDIAAGRWTVPSLSTVAPDRGRLVDRALAVLERQIAAPAAADQPVEQITVPFTVVDRGSTAT